MEKSCTK